MIGTDSNTKFGDSRITKTREFIGNECSNSSAIVTNKENFHVETSATEANSYFHGKTMRKSSQPKYN
ncbi:unnamed protein product [Rhizophagus irregularis]|nr:unnamed protein product [Rhizophagus irregularis]